MLECETVKKGRPCPFMTPKGCGFNGGSCRTVGEQCEGCANIMELSTGRYCLKCPDPSAKWRFGECNMATHARDNNNKEIRRINPLKASKRKAKNK